eukprot:gene1291-944_t
MELGDPPSAPPNTERKRHSGNIEEEEDDDNDHCTKEYPREWRDTLERMRQRDGGDALPGS